MSLIDEYTEPCVMLDKVTAADGYGGYTTIWREGAEFNAVIVLDTSMQTRIAEKQGVTSVYTVSTKKAMTLKFPDVFRRISDGKTFRVTSDGTDKASPESAGIDLRVVTAEEYTPTGGMESG